MCCWVPVFCLCLYASLIPTVFGLFHILCLLSTDIVLIFLFCDAIHSFPHHSFHTSPLSLFISISLCLCCLIFIPLLPLSFISSFVHLLVSCFCETHIKGKLQSLLSPASVVSLCFILLSFSSFTQLETSACSDSLAALYFTLYFLTLYIRFFKFSFYKILYHSVIFSLSFSTHSSPSSADLISVFISSFLCPIYLFIFPIYLLFPSSFCHIFLLLY